MKYEITRRGVYDAKGKAFEIGDIVDIKGDDIPGWLVNKAEPVKAEKKAVTNPAKFEAKAKGDAWVIVGAGNKEVGKPISEADAKAFNEMSDEDKADFAAEHAKA